MRTTARLLFGAIFATAALIPGWIWLHSTDLKAARDGDLQVKRYIAPPDHNGVELLRRALDVLMLSDEESRLAVTLSSSEDWEPEHVAELLGRDAEALEIVDEALAATYFVLPPMTDLARPEMVGWQKLAKLLVLRAALFASEDDPWGAAADWQRILTLGARIERARGGALLSANVGLSIRLLGLEAIEHHARAELLPEAVGLELAKALSAYRSDPESWSEIWLTEYQALRPFLSQDFRVAADALEVRAQPSSLLQRLVPSSYVFQPNRTREQLADYFRSRSRQVAMPCSGQTRPPVAPIDAGDAGALRQLLLEPNGLGRLVVQEGMDRYALDEFKRCAADTRLAATQALLGLRAYEVVEGRLPEALNDLVPDYLDAVPIDAFDGRPLRFRPDRRIVYSVGADFADDGGEPEGSLAAWNDPEPTLPLGPPPSA
jgi:hypothetical protein